MHFHVLQFCNVFHPFFFAAILRFFDRPLAIVLTFFLSDGFFVVNNLTFFCEHCFI